LQDREPGGRRHTRRRDAITGSAHILIADDVAEVREVVRFHLERAGYRVSEVADGREALAFLRQESPDVLLLDLTMPEIDGWGVLEAAQAEGQLEGVRVALLTAEADEIAEFRGRRSGAHAYLAKPLEAGDLTRAVERLLDDRPAPA